MDRRIVLGGAVLAGADASLRLDCGVLIEGARIVAVGPNAQLTAHADDAEILDARDLILCPGWVNAHHHAYGLLAHGIPIAGDAPRGFDRFLSDLWWPRVEDRLDGSMIEAAMAVSCADMIRSGFTAFCDVLEAPLAGTGVLDLEARAVERAGLRAVLCLEASERHGAEVGRQALWENERFARERGCDGLVRGMQCLHTSFTCSEGFVRAAKESAVRAGCDLHLHLSESAYEPKECLRRHGVRPVHWYDQLGFWDETVLASQVVAVTDDEIARLAERRVRIAHMPLSNCEVGGGIAPIPQMIERGLEPGLGTDGYINDPFEVMRGAFLLHKGAARDASVMPARTVLGMATAWGARAIGFPEAGALAPGHPADLIGIDDAPGTPLTADNVADQLVLFRGRGDVKLTIVAGRVLFRNGVVETMDEGAVRAAARLEVARLWAGRGRGG
ncbi:MAG: amidohydrolase family protein [Candidatus Bipolaricaulota bacterium]|nr:amidohydrolase family protein [Candidatus Bipolaricaulota bacterium]